MYKELELWKAVEMIHEVLKLQYPPLSTGCGGDFKEFECCEPNKDGMSCDHYTRCLTCQKVGELSTILDDNKIHISSLEAEKTLNEGGKCYG